MNTSEKLMITSSVAVKKWYVSKWKISKISNTFKIRLLIQVTLCRNVWIQRDLSKNNFLSKGRKLYSWHWEKNEGTSMVNTWVPRVFVHPFMVPILSWKLKVITYRSNFAIPPSSKLGLLCQYEITSWHYIVIKTSIIDDLEVQDPLVCLFLMQNITKKVKI